MKKSTFVLLFWSACTLLSAQTWEPMAAGLLPNNRVIFSISAVGDNVVWAVASEQFFNPPIPLTHKPLILRSSDAGLHWTVHEVEEAAGMISFRIVAIDSLTAWITTQDYNNGAGRALFKTEDGGINWTEKLSNVSAGVALNRFADGVHWLAHNRSATSRSANDGENWTNLTISGYQSNEVQLLNSGTNMSTSAGDTLWNGTNGGRIIRFTNYGADYAFINVGLGNGTSIMSIAFQDHLNGLCWTQNALGANRIARSTDGGASWLALTQQPGLSIGWNIAAVPGSPDSYVLASNSNFSQGKIATTTNAGDSWLIQDMGQSLNAVEFTSANRGWVGAGQILSGTQPAIFRYSGGPISGSKEALPELPGFSVAPNPVSDVVRIDFEGAAQASALWVTLTDMAGKIVFSGLVANRSVDLSHLPGGVYFISVTSGGKTGRAKLVRE